MFCFCYVLSAVCLALLFFPALFGALYFFSKTSAWKSRFGSANFTKFRLVFEALAAGLDVECKNVLCNERMKILEYLRHMETCEYRPIRCCNSMEGKNCGNIIVDWESYVQHILDFHSFSRSEVLEEGWSSVQSRIFWQGNNTSGMEKNTRTPCSTEVFETEGMPFLLHMRRELALGYIWISSMLNEKEATKFRAEVYILKDGIKASIDGDYHVKWNLEISSVHKTLNDLKYTKSCIAIPVRSLLVFSSQPFDNEEYWSTCFQIKIYPI